MQDVVLEKLQKELVDRLPEVVSYYKAKSDSDILKEAKKEVAQSNGDVFISDGVLYREIKFNHFRVTTVLSYIYNNGKLSNIIGIEDDGRIKLYEKAYPWQLRKMLIGKKLHEILENKALSLLPLKSEQTISAVIDGDTVVGKLDLAEFNRDNFTIIEIKTGKLHEELAKMQLAVYIHMLSLKKELGNKTNIAIVHPNGVIKGEIKKNEINQLVNKFIQAKREIKNELMKGKFYIFRKVKNVE
jgi:hypothetical protein